MKEKVFSSLLRIKLKNKGHWTRVENIAGVGIPDINFFYKGKDIWIETKVAKGQRVIFEASQVTWYKQRYKYGGDYLIFVRKDDWIWIAKASTIFSSPGLLWSGACTKPYMVLSLFEDLSIFKDKKPVNWEGIYDILKSF